MESRQYKVRCAYTCICENFMVSRQYKDKFEKVTSLFKI